MVRFAIGNPYAILAIVVALGLVALAVFPMIPVDVLPDFKTPVVVSFYSYPGLPTEVMERSVAERIERVNTLASGLEHQESRTLPGAAVLKAYFHPGTNPSSAMNDIVNLEASDFFHLPPGIEPPFVMKSDPGNLPVILAAVSGEGLSETELFTIGYYEVRNRMGGLKGVQVPHPFGGRYRQMMVYVDPKKLEGLGLSSVDVVEALRKANLIFGSGTMKLGRKDYQVQVLNTLPGAQDIDMVPIAVHDGRPIFIRDVGYTKDDAAIQYNIVRVNGQRSVYVPLLREPGANTIQVVDRIAQAVKEEIPRAKAIGEIPQAVKVDLLGDQSAYIRIAIHNLLEEIGLGAVLVGVVVGLFLRRLAPTLAVVLILPTALVVGILGFYFLGSTINVLTLGGLAMAVGTVVDGGIVVVENTMRHLAAGQKPADAARIGAEEVIRPVLTGNLATIIVFVPAVFLTGMVGVLFQSLTLAATLTIGASFFLALTVVPAFSSCFLRRHEGHGDHPVAEVAGGQPRGFYSRILQLAMRHRLVVIGGCLAFAFASLLLYPALGTELFPDVDASSFELRVRTIPGTRVEETEKIVARVEKILKDVIPAEDLETTVANIGLPVGKGAGFSTILSPNSGPDSAFLIVNLRQKGRKTGTQEYIQRLRPVLAKEFPQEQFLYITGGIINAALNEGAATPISIQVSGSSLEKARRAAEELVRRVRTVRGAADVQIAQTLDYPQFEVQVDRTRAAYLGLTQRQVAENVLTALGSSTGFAPSIWIDPKTGLNFWMGVQYESNEAPSLETLQNLPLTLHGADGPVTVPLSNVATIRRANMPGEIAHHNITRVYDVLVNLQGRDLGSVAADVEKLVAEMPPQEGVLLSIRGPVTRMHEALGRLAFSLLLVAVLVYLVTMAQFRSFLDPLIMMLAVVPGLAGVLWVLFLTRTSLNIQSFIGTLTMIGVVVNNSILLVEFANVLCQHGYDPANAVVRAAGIRLRPILMTAFVLVASMLPASVSWAPGSEAMIPLARALLGGMLVSTFVTLFLVPCVYSLLKTGGTRGETAVISP
jgi:HAE1 family hydrophobic/amphiphilic exporter-1